MLLWERLTPSTQFIAWTTYTDGHLVGVDNDVTQNYMSSLRVFSSLGSVEAKTSDYEFRNR
jgi:protein EFR3